MEDREIKQIEEQIRSLPKGTITIKHIQEREYEYWQYRENGKQIFKRVKGEELETIQAQINERKRLEKVLGNYRKIDPKQLNASLVTDNSLHGLIRTGDDLIRFTEPVRKFRKREIFKNLSDYIYSTDNDRVFMKSNTAQKLYLSSTDILPILRNWRKQKNNTEKSANVL